MTIQFLIVLASIAASVANKTQPSLNSHKRMGNNGANHLPTSPVGEKWSYVTVRPGVHMFWWYYPCRNISTGNYNQSAIPLVIWLQGGPGEAASGMGNFLEIGPYDIHWQYRNTTWSQLAHVLFIDSPVGAGFSYADNQTLYTRDEQQIATDLLNVLKHFFKTIPHMLRAPIYIYGQSYGGKMAVSFASLLSQAIAKKTIQWHLAGIGLFDPLISPIDTVKSYVRYYKTFSLMDDDEAQSANEYVANITQLIDRQQFGRASTMLIDLLRYIVNVTGLVDIYNTLQHLDDNPFESSHHSKRNTSITLLSQLMNGPIRNALAIIPQNLTWQAGNGLVYQVLNYDIMQSVTDKVEYLLNHSNITIDIFGGQLDGLTNAIGTQAWIDKLKWSHLSQYQQHDKVPIYDEGEVIAFSKSYSQLSYHWILNAGHYAIRDAPSTTFKLFQRAINRGK